MSAPPVSGRKRLQPLCVKTQSRIESPDKLLEAVESERLIQEAIANLPEDQRLLVVLRDVEELSYQEIADQLSLPEGTVKSRINRGRTELARQVQRIRAEEGTE